MTSTISAETAQAPLTGARRRHFRPDIQGLRAVAVLLVLLYHGGLPWIPGGYAGVDVFFVISGFLITGLLIRELTTTGTIHLVDFYARRARRILPAALLVILATLAATVLWLPAPRWASTAWDALFSSVSVVNWQFAIESTEYLQQDQAPSPLQHYWSLAVEEQYYLFWPLLVLFLATGLSAGRAARRRRIAIARPAASLPSHRVICRRVLVGSLAVAALSLVHSVQFSPADPGAAYFITTTRLWELAVGAALAAALPLAPRLSPALGGVLGWIGLAAVLIAAVVLDAETVFPGYAALLPVLGSALVILAGAPGRDARWSAAEFLSLRPMRFIGDISFSLYLVHWPVLVIVNTAVFSDDMPARIGIPLALATIVPAWLLYRYVERPLMRWPFLAPRRTALRMGLAGMVVVALAATALAVLPPLARSASADSASTGSAQPIGAAALAQDPQSGTAVDQVGAFVPAAADAAEDKPASSLDGCNLRFDETDPVPCVYGRQGADVRIALVGDSHAGHWLPALQAAAEDRGWEIHVFTKSACAVIATPVIRKIEGVPTEYTECQEWNEKVVDAVAAVDPDLVVISGSRHTPAGEGSIAEGMAEAWQRFTDAGLDVAVLNDIPRVGVDVPECVAMHPDRLTECAADRDKANDASGAADLRTAAQLHGGVEFLDLNRFICPAEQCAPVIGKVLVYSDSHHMTATYSATLGPVLDQALAPLVDGR